MAHDPSDPEIALRPRQEPDLTGTLFAPWPEAPPAPRGEQRELPIRPAPEAILAAWRATSQGQAMYSWIAGQALDLLAHGAARLSAKYLLERAREHFKHATDNRVTPALARSLEDEFPTLRSKFEKRKRAA